MTSEATAPQADIDRFLEAAVRPWLAHADGEIVDLRIDEIRTPTSGGFSNGTWSFRTRWTSYDGAERSRRLVLRTPPEGPTLLHVPTLDLQAEMMIALEHTAVPVPTVVWRSPDESDLGRSYFLMEHLDGRPAPDSPPYTQSGWMLDLPPQERRRAHFAAIEAMAAVHAVDLKSLDAPALERPNADRDALDVRLDFYRAHYANAARELGRSNPHVERGLAWLEGNRPTTHAEPVLIWGDSRLGNVLFEDDSAEVAALLDWEFACIASPAHDLSHWLFADRYFTEGIGVTRPEGFPTAAEQEAHYSEITGRTLDDLPYYDVALALQSAVNMMRVAQMSLDAGWAEPSPELGIDTGGTLLLRRLLGEDVLGMGQHFTKG